MSRDLRDLGRTVDLRPVRRRRRLVPLVAAIIVVAAVGARASDHEDPSLDELMAPSAESVDAAPEAPAAEAAPEAPPAIVLPVLGRSGGLLLHVPAIAPVAVSYHEASFPEARAIDPLGNLAGNENSTRPLAHAPHPDGLDFHVQVSRGRANASTSAVDVLLPAGEEVRAPVAGTVTEVRPYQLYGTHDDVRIELRPDAAPDLAVVLIHVDGVVVEAGDHLELGDVIAGSARQFPFGAVVDRLTEPERYGHVHMEVKAPD